MLVDFVYLYHEIPALHTNLKKGWAHSVLQLSTDLLAVKVKALLTDFTEGIPISTQI